MKTGILFLGDGSLEYAQHLMFLCRMYNNGVKNLRDYLTVDTKDWCSSEASMQNDKDYARNNVCNDRWFGNNIENGPNPSRVLCTDFCTDSDHFCLDPS